MKGTGWSLIILGAVLFLVAWFTETSVRTDLEYLPGIGIQEPKDVVNLGLLQKQMMLLVTSLAAIIGGLVALCAAEIRDAMVRAGPTKHEPPIEPEITSAAA